MSFSEMNKEQKQLVVLAVMGLVTAISVVSNMIIGPAREDAAEASVVIKEKKAEVATGEAVLIRDARNQRDIADFSVVLKEVHEEFLPPESSTYIWAVEKLSLIAEELDMVIKVRQHPSARYRVTSRVKSADLAEDTIPMWIPYATDVDMNASFAKLQSYLNLLREKVPYASVSRIRISAGGQNPEEHAISLIVEWPTFRFPEDLEWIQSESEKVKE